jgi:CHC2 zinc finger
MCGGRDRFSINARKQVFNCRGCGAKGDVIALVKALDGVDFRAAVETLAGPAPTPKPNGHNENVIEFARRPSVKTLADNSSFALRIWHESINPRGTLVEQYLCSRSLDLPSEVRTKSFALTHIAYSAARAFQRWSALCATSVRMSHKGFSERLWRRTERPSRKMEKPFARADCRRRYQDRSR